MDTSKDDYNAHECQVVYRKFDRNEKLADSNQVRDFLKPMYTHDWGFREEFYLLCVDRGNHPIAWRRMSTGSQSGTVVDFKLIAKIAIETMASGVIISHNHPSGNLEPSVSDIQLTKKLKEALKLFEISVLDHISVGDDLDGRYYSFADEGIL